MTEETKGPQLLRLSVSRTKTYVDCNKKYDFAYNLKLPQKERDYLTFGKFIHKTLEDFHQYYLNGDKDPLNLLMQKAFNVALKEFKELMTADAIKEGYDMADAYLKRITNDKKTLDSVISVEKNFNTPITENISLVGMIDRIQIDPDGVLHVVDYKTSKSDKYLLKDMLQLLTYAYILYTEDNSIKKVRGSYVMLRQDFKYITQDFDLKEILEIKGKYENYANMIRNDKEWKANPTFLCNWCSFQDVCDDAYRDSKSQSNKFGLTKW